MKYYINRFAANTGPVEARCPNSASTWVVRWLAILLITLFAGFSQTVSAQRIITGEYFYNTDPGVGKGTAISLAATSAVNASFTMPTTGLSGGVQQLFVRFKDSVGRWGVAEQRTFYVNTTSGVVTPLSPIINAEYFFDTDPGVGHGKALAVTKSDSLLITSTVITTGLLKGPHQLFIRFKDSVNRWGIAEQRLFYVDSFPIAATILSPMIAGEYFYDTDPGVGRGTAITIPKGDSLTLTTSAHTEGLTSGIHQLFIRLKDSLSRWSIAEQRTFIIDAAINATIVKTPLTNGEYFIDTDPGVGKAIAMTINKADSINTQFNLASTIKPGVHQLFIRLKDSVNRWGIAEQRTFFVDSALTQPSLAPIVAAEYFFNTDTGVGRGTPIPITKADSVNKVFQLALPSSITGGTNYLYVRFKDSTGRWSLAEPRLMPAIVCKPNLGPDTTVTICAGTAANIQAMYAYKGFASGTWSTTRPDSAGVGVYTLIVTSSQGCKDTAVVTVNNFPKPHLGNDTTIIISNSSIKKDLTTLYNTTGLTAVYNTTTPQSVGAGTYRLIVTDGCGFKDTAVIVITLYVPPPVINSFSPVYSGAGATITITGKYFTGATVVSFGGTPAAQFTVVNDSVITAVTGTGTTGSVLVTTPGGTVSKPGFTICTPVTPSVSIATSKASPICASTKVTFTATATNGGTAPAYQWHKNNTTVGTNTNTYTDSALKNSDSVWCVVTSNASCLAAPTGKSNVMVYVVNPIATPSVTIAANNASPICANTKVIFTATATNGGTATVYLWYKNNAVVGTNIATYTDSTLRNNDSVWCTITSNVACATATSAKSNVLKYAVNTAVTASVSITANPSAATCQSTPVLFTATAVNGGTTPSYQWKKGSANVGTNLATYTDTLPVNGDSITVVLTSNSACAVSHTVNSNGIKLTVNAKPNLGKDSSVYTCLGTAVNIRNIYNTTGLTATWTTARPDSITAPGAYTLTVTSTSGCKDTAVVTVGNYPKPSLGKDTTVLTCPGTAANIKNIYTTTGLTTSWNTTRPDSVVAGAYTLTVTNSNGCKDTAVVTVGYYAKPNLGNDTTVVLTSTTATTNITTLYKLTGLTATYSTTTPTAVGAGTYMLYVVNSCGLKDTAVIKVIVVTSAPIITAFSPVNTYAGSTVTITGKYFTGTTVVSFGGVAATSYSVINDSVIIATVGTGASGSVLVTTPGGTATKAGFTICSGVTPSISITTSAASPICAKTKVTFTATAVNGGTAPHYQWYKNSVAVGTSATTYVDSLLNNGDSVWSVVTSNAACLVANTTKSNVFKYVVNPIATPSVSVAANVASPICTATKVTFTATATNGGTATVYKWYKNNAVVGTNTTTYIDSTLKTNDSVWCIITSNVACATATSAKSNVLKYAVNTTVTASVSMAANPSAITCQGTAVTFTATAVNGGTTPVYQWRKGSTNVGANLPTYTNTLPVNGDSITVILTSNNACAVAKTVTSNGIKLTVNAKPNLGKDSSVYTCAGTVVNIKNIYNTTGFTAVWNTARPDSIVAPGIYTLTVTSASGCKDTAVVTVGDYPKPSLGKDTTVLTCPNTAANIKNIYNTTGLTAVWNTTRPDSVKAGVYTLTVTNSNGCKDTAVVTVSNYNKPNLGKDTTVFVTSSTATTDITKLYNVTGLTAQYNTTTPTAAGVGTYTLIVTNSCSLKDTAVITVKVVLPAPIITAFSPVSTYTGGSVTITGKYFTGATVVSFGGVAAAHYSVLNDSVINAAVNTGASGSVLVTTPGGTATKAGFTICSAVTPSISISSNASTTICAKTKVTFTATAVNGGTAPSYQWYKNNVAIGTHISSYVDTALNTGDSIWCVVTSNAACLIANSAKSNQLKFTVNALVTPTVTIAANMASPICSGVKVTFTATATNGGTFPAYQWYKDNSAVGTNSATYTDSLIKNGDSVWCVVTSNAACLAAVSAKSNVLKYAVSFYSLVSVSITANPGSAVCAGSPVTFTATPSGGGTAPVFQWKKNRVNVGTNSTTYIDSVPVTGDSVYVTLTSSATCVTVHTVSSTGIKLTVNAKPNLGKDTSVYTCPGTAANISGLYNLTGYKTSWSTTRPDSITVAGAYTLIVVNGNGCRDTAIVTVGKYAKPNVGNDTSVYVCPGYSINLATVYKTTGLSTSWSTPKPDIAQAGHYTLIVTNANGCKDTALVTVNNYTKPNLGKDTAVYTCPGTARNLNNVYNLTALTPLWSTSRPDSAVAGIYIVRVTNSTGCKDTAVITLSNYAKPNLGKDTTVSTCLGTALNIKGVYNLTGLTSVWNTARPDSITAAGAYTVTVTNTTGCKDTAVVTVSNHPKPNLGKDTAVSVCPGTAVNMQTLYTTTGLKTTWSTTRPDSVTTAGAYTLIVNNTYGCKDTAVITIKNYPKPNLGKDSAVYTCLGTSVNITGLYNLTGLTPTWNTTRPDSIREAGNYTLVVKNATGCKDTAIVTVVTPAPPAKPNIKVEGGTTFCLGDSLALITNPGSGALQWYRNNGAIRLASGGTYEVKIGGNYKVKLTTGTNGVCNVMSDSVAVIVTQVTTPTISVVNDTLVSSSPTGNQWFEDGVLIPGATSQKYYAINIDEYTVQVKSGNCTSAMSYPYIYTAGTNAKKVLPGVTDGDIKILLYPNPAQDATHLQISGFSGGVIATITDLEGKVVWQQDKLTNGAYTLPLSSLASGMYIVTVKDRFTIKSLKLIKAK